MPVFKTNKINKKVFPLLVSFFLFSGCTLITKAPQLMALKRFSDSQKQIERYIAAQEKKLAILKADIKNNRLEKGTAYCDILRRYGSPVLEKELDGQQGFSKELLYRHPVEYFNTDRIYLYFDSALNLAQWEYQPKRENNSLTAKSAY